MRVFVLLPEQIPQSELPLQLGDVEAGLRKVIVPHLKPEPFDDYFELWLKLYKPGVAGNTMARYLNTLNTIRERFPGEPIQNFTKRGYQAFLNEYGATRAKTTTQKLNTHIRACVKDAIEEGIIHVDFTRGAVLTGNVPAKRDEEKHLSQLKRCIEGLDRRRTSSQSGRLKWIVKLWLSSRTYSSIRPITSMDLSFIARRRSIKSCAVRL
jgi:hypothetical protein